MKNNFVIKIFGLICLIYIFLLSILLLGDSFKLLGHGFAAQLVNSVSNPFTALLIGILSTSIIQSSTVTSSMVVGLVGGLGVASVQAGASGAAAVPVLTIYNAIPIIMGANIGTSVTNILVSLGHITNRIEFRRAFAAAVIHDFFNLMAVIIFLPIQLATNFIGIAAGKASLLLAAIGGLKFASPIKYITSPIIDLIQNSALGIGWLDILIALILLFLALSQIVKILKSLVLTKVEVFFDTYIFKTAGRAMLLGFILTAIVHSSSITTSLMVPLAGAGMLSLEQVFPYTLGANVGTTMTALLAAFAIGRQEAIAIALSHVFFNIFGIVVIWPIRKIPLNLAKRFSVLAMKKRYIPILFVATVFYLIPLSLIFLTR